MYKNLLVPLDGSDFAEEALPMARLLASRLGARLHLLHVIQPFPEMDLDWKGRAREKVGEYLEGLAQGIRDEDGTEVETSVVEGRVVPALREQAAAAKADLFVVTTHGHGGMRRWWLGSVADGLIRTTRRHLLLVRPWDDTEDRRPGEPRFGKVAVALDGSETGERAIPPAADLARRFDAELTLIRVVPSPVELTSIYGLTGVRVEGEGHRERVEEARRYLEGVASHLDDGGVVEATVLEDDDAAEGVVEGAKGVQADLLALSTHGRGAFARAVLGSVADKVIRSTTLPILVVPTGEDE